MLASLHIVEDRVEDNAIQMEAAPLLEQRQENPAVPPRRLIYQVPSSRIAVFFLAFIIFCLALAGSLTIVPTTRLLEDILCHHHYKNNQDHDGEIDESLCKIDPIQSELAYFKGFLSTLEAIIGMYTFTNSNTRMSTNACRTGCRSSLW